MNSQARPLLLRAIETGDYSELIDRRLEKHYVEHEVVRMIETAAACVRHSGPKRPRMAQVNFWLKSFKKLLCYILFLILIFSCLKTHLFGEIRL